MGIFELAVDGTAFEVLIPLDAVEDTPLTDVKDRCDVTGTSRLVPLTNTGVEESEVLVIVVVEVEALERVSVGEVVEGINVELDEEGTVGLSSPFVTTK
jgi:hypothetical protein